MVFFHTFTWISHGCTCVPHPKPSSHVPPHPIPQDLPSALDLSALSHASNLDWRSISHMVICMFQCCLSNHPTLAFSHTPKVCSLHLCLFCCLTYRVIINIFLNSMWSEMKLLSHVWLFVTPWTVAYQAPPSMEFSRQEYWSGLPCPSPGDLPNPGIEPGLVICFTYDNIHVSMLFSQIIPPSPSPTESKRLFYTSVSLLLSHIQGYHYHLSKFHIYVLVYCIGVFLSGLLHSV